MSEVPLYKMDATSKMSEGEKERERDRERERARATLKPGTCRWAMRAREVGERVDLSSRFRFFNFGFRVPVSGYQVSGSRFRVPGFGFRVSGFGFRF